MVFIKQFVRTYEDEIQDDVKKYKMLKKLIVKTEKNIKYLQTCIHFGLVPNRHAPCVTLRELLSPTEENLARQKLDAILSMTALIVKYNEKIDGIVQDLEVLRKKLRKTLSRKDFKFMSKVINDAVESSVLTQREKNVERIMLIAENASKDLEKDTILHVLSGDD